MPLVLSRALSLLRFPMAPRRSGIPESPYQRRWRRTEARNRRRATLRARASRMRSPVLTVGCLGFLDASAWTLHPTLGLATVGVSLGLLEWLTRTDR